MYEDCEAAGGDDVAKLTMDMSDYSYQWEASVDLTPGRVQAVAESQTSQTHAGGTVPVWGPLSESHDDNLPSC